ncbi:MAG: T9SS type A sorting domain-containing protein [Prolixibacteraceae bacterium]
MQKLLFFSLLLIVVLTTGNVNGQTIIVVSDDAGVGQAYADELSATGYVVEVKTDLNVEPSQSQMDELDAADLIVILRNTNSAEYNYPDSWNYIDTPILMASCFLTRSSRFAWLNTTEVNEADGVDISIVDDAHPIFEGMDLSAGTMAINSTMPLHTNPIDDAGNGSIIAVSATTGNIVIAEWKIDTDFYDGGDYYAAEYRAVFFTGISYDFTNEGKQLFLNFVNYILTLDEQTSSKKEMKEQITVYPMPAGNSLNIKGVVASNSTYEIVSLSGQVLISSQLTENRQVDISSLKSGLYVIKMMSNNQLMSQKFIKR